MGDLNGATFPLQTKFPLISQDFSEIKTIGSGPLPEREVVDQPLLTLFVFKPEYVPEAFKL